jgi:Conjugal transfer protein
VHAAPETARVVKYSQDDIVTVYAKLRYSTLIVLPENEEILDFTTGDKDFWIINDAHNLCYTHPAPGIQFGFRHSSLPFALVPSTSKCPLFMRAVNTPGFKALHWLQRTLRVHVKIMRLVSESARM